MLEEIGNMDILIKFIPTNTGIITPKIIITSFFRSG